MAALPAEQTVRVQGHLPGVPAADSLPQDLTQPTRSLRTGAGSTGWGSNAILVKDQWERAGGGHAYRNVPKNREEWRLLRPFQSQGGPCPLWRRASSESLHRSVDQRLAYLGSPSCSGTSSSSSSLPLYSYSVSSVQKR